MVAFQLKAPRWGGVSHLAGYADPKKTSISKDSCESERAGSDAISRNDAGTRNDSWHKSDTAGSGSVLGSNENPGALAGATGADQDTIGIVSKPYSKPLASAMSRYAKDAHKRVCRMLGFALTLDDPATWHQTAAILNHRLTRLEVASLAFAALSALEPEDRDAVYGASMWGIA